MSDLISGAEEEWQLTFDSLTDGISIHDRNRTILKANVALGGILGVPTADLIGKKCYKLFHSADCPPDECPLSTCLEIGKPLSYETFEPHLGRWLSISISPVLNGSPETATIVHVVRDITGRKAAEQALYESERRFRSLVENTSECICNIDLNGYYLYMTPGGLASHDLNLDELRSMHYCELAEPPYHEMMNQKFQEAKDTGAPVQFEYESDTTKGIRWFQSTLSPVRDDFDEITSFIRVSRDIQDQKKAQRERDRLFSAVEQLAEMILIADPNEKILYVNPAFEKVTGYARSELLGSRIGSLGLGAMHGDQLSAQIRESIAQAEAWQGTLLSHKKDGSTYSNDVHLSPVLDAFGYVSCFVAVMRDVTEEIRLELQLSQAQKLEAIGQLAAGIAHEINTPTQYVSDNTRFLLRSFVTFSDALASLEKFREAARSGAVPDALSEEVDSVIKRAKLEYLLEEIPQAIDESLSGLEQITNIVRAMKEFSHPGSKELSQVDINNVIENTITVSRNEWKYVAEMVTSLDPDLPFVPGLPGDLKQVILNLIVNAAHAIAAKMEGTGLGGTITISTRALDSAVEISVNDTGTGIPDQARSKIFDPFFTTKEVGKGTGQGLAISRSVIVDKHRGTIDFDTRQGEGTTFIITLPKFESLDKRDSNDK